MMNRVMISAALVQGVHSLLLKPEIQEIHDNVGEIGEETYFEELQDVLSINIDVYNQF